MDPEEDQNQNQQDQDQPSLSDQGVTKKVAKKGFQTLRGVGAAGEAAEAAEAGAAAAGAEATAGGAAAATGATEGLATAAAGEAGAATAAATGAATEGALTGTAIASGSASMGWAIAAVLIIVFIFTIVIVITGGGGVPVNAGTPPANSCADAGGTCKTSCDSTDTESTIKCDGTANKCCLSKTPPEQTNFPKCQTLDTDPSGCLKKDFNIAVKGQGYPVTQDNLQTIYKIFWENSQALNYRRLLIRGGQLLTITVTGCRGFCISHSTTDTSIFLNGFFTRGRLYEGLRYLLTHESGHLIERRNPQLYRLFPLSTLGRADGTSCYDHNSSAGHCSRSRSGYFMKSYALRYYCPVSGLGSCWAVTDFHESFAEALANYLTIDSVNKTGFWCSVTINNFKSQCSTTYTWLYKNIFDRYEFQ